MKLVTEAQRVAAEQRAERNYQYDAGKRVGEAVERLAVLEYLRSGGTLAGVEYGEHRRAK